MGGGGPFLGTLEAGKDLWPKSERGALIEGKCRWGV